MLPPLEDIDRELCERSLSHYLRHAWPVIEPGTAYLHNWHIDAICEHLEAVDAGQIARLLINMPPRHMKSIAVTIGWPTWSWIRHPSERWLFGSYSGSLSTKHSVDRRTIIQSDWYQGWWGDKYQLTSDQNVKTEYRNDKQGVMVAAGFGGSATGKGGNRIVIDDPADPTQAESPVVAQSTIDTFDRKFSTRLDDKKRGAIVIVMQRLSERDLSAHVLEQGGYTHLKLEAEAETTIISLPSGRIITRKPGELLWPEREGPKEIAAAKRQLGSYGYAGQYQQRPAPAEGGKFKKAWFRYYRPDGEFHRLITGNESDRLVRVADCTRFITADIAGTEAKAGNPNDPDYSVFATWDMTEEGDLILVDLWRDRCEEPDVVRAGVRATRAGDVQFSLVEKNGLGSGVVNTMRRKGCAVRPIIAKTSKVVRAQTAMVRMEAGTIYLPKGSPLNHDIETELMNFPNAAHDDIVDTFSIAAMHAQRACGAVPDDEDREHETATAEQEQSANEHHRQQPAAVDELGRDRNLDADADREEPAESMWMSYNGDDD